MRRRAVRARDRAVIEFGKRCTAALRQEFGDEEPGDFALVITSLPSGRDGDAALRTLLGDGMKTAAWHDG